METALPLQKLKELHAELQLWSSCKKCCKCKLLSLIGHIFLCHLIDLSTAAWLPQNHITMNVEARQDIAWWLQFLLMCNGHSIISDPYWSRSPDLALFTDASGTVCYAVYSATTGLPNLGQLHVSYRTAPSSGKSFTLLLYFGVTYGLGKRFSSTVTTSLWLISGFPGHPVTLKTCTSFTPALLVLTTQLLTPYPN